MTKVLTVDELVECLWQLPARDRWHVVGQVVARAERESRETASGKAPSETVEAGHEKRSQWGALAHLGKAPSDEDIREMRAEAWGRFPRESPRE